MKRSKPSVPYQGMSFPVPLVEEVRRFIQEKPEYRSIAEFCSEAIREKLHKEQMVVCQRLPDKIICNGTEYVIKGKSWEKI